MCEDMCMEILNDTYEKMSSFFFYMIEFFFVYVQED